MRTAQNLNSGILPTGSISSIVSRFAAASRKWNGMKQFPGGLAVGHPRCQHDRPPARGHPDASITDLRADLAPGQRAQPSSVHVRIPEPSSMLLRQRVGMIGALPRT